MNLSMKYSNRLVWGFMLVGRVCPVVKSWIILFRKTLMEEESTVRLRLLSEDPVPAKGYPGDTVVFKADGLLDYCVPEKGNMLLNSIWENRKPKYWLPPIRR